MNYIHLEIVEATEQAAIAASSFVGCGDKIAADRAATQAMRARLNKINFAGRVVIGEGEKDGAPGLFKDELVGTLIRGIASSAGSAAEADAELPCFYELAVDPIDGTTQTAKGGYEAMSVLAMGTEKALFSTETFYMNKIAVGPKVAKTVSVSLLDPIKRTVQLIAMATGKDRITACLLDRPRHEKLVSELRKCGCRIKFIQDCDVSGAIAAALPESGIDLFIGIGGAPEGVIAAVALKCLGGDFQGMLVDNDSKPQDGKLLAGDDLAKGDVVFAATGITNGSLLKGVRYTPHGFITHSITMNSAHRHIRWIESHHGDVDEEPAMAVGPGIVH